jgi:hypothetical protein
MSLIITIHVLIDAYIMVISYFYLQSETSLVKAVELLAVLNIDLVFGALFSNFLENQVKFNEK